MPRRPVAGQDAPLALELQQAEDATGCHAGQPPVPAGKDPKEGPEAVEQVKPWETRLDHCASEKGERRKEKRKKDEKEKHEKKSKRDKKAQKEKEVQPHSSTVGRRGEVVEELDLDRLLAGGDMFEVSMEDGATLLPSTPDPVLEQRRKIEKILADAGGELRLSLLEHVLSTRIEKQALVGFSIVPSADGDSLKDLVRLTSKQACQLLEGPSLQMASLEEAYFDLGNAVLQAGLDFANEEKFQNLFDDFLAKREDLRLSAQRNSFIPYVPRSRASHRSRKDLPPMTQFEKNLLQDVQRVLKARPKESWISLSELFEDPAIRRARCKLPRGLSLWEWISLRCPEIRTVNERSDMLLQMATEGGTLNSLEMTLEERKQELSLAVFETLAILQRNFPDGGGLSLEDLQQVPAVARLQFGRPALQQALGRMKTVKVVSRADGQQMVQLRPVAEVLGKASEPEKPILKEKEKPGKEATTTATTSATSTTIKAAPAHAPAARPLTSTASLVRQTSSQGHQSHLPDRLPITVEGWSRVQDQFFKGWPPLPEGWIRVISRSTGKVFFVDQNNSSGVGQMELPGGPQEAESNYAQSFRQLAPGAATPRLASR